VSRYPKHGNGKGTYLIIYEELLGQIRFAEVESHIGLYVVFLEKTVRLMRGRRGLRDKIVKTVDQGELVCIYGHLAIVNHPSMKPLSLVLAISINQTWQL
jgi:hypothetical protein